MKISVDPDVCDGHGQCSIVDPDLFPLDDDGYCDIGRGKPVPAGQEAIARDGVAACPVSALTVDED
jgi:ferredoxin